MQKVQKVELILETLTNKKEIAENYINILKESNEVLKTTYIENLMGDRQLRKNSKEAITNNITELEELYKQVKQLSKDIPAQHKLIEIAYEDYKFRMMQEQKKEAKKWQEPLNDGSN